MKENPKGIGLDIAPKMIARAREKARKADLSIGFQVASIDEVPFSDEYYLATKGLS
jgi:ubiquinone/menaquinone biosynthesis C-methylase UbiE